MCTREESRKLLQNSVKRIDEKIYRFKSLTRDETYSINFTEIGWICSCPDHRFIGVKCKHIHAVEFSLDLRIEVKRIEEVVISGCKYCKSDLVVKCGLRKKQTWKLTKISMQRLQPMLYH